MRVTRKESPSEHWDNCTIIRAVKINIVCFGKNINFYIENFSGLPSRSRLNMEMVNSASNSCIVGLAPGKCEKNFGSYLINSSTKSIVEVASQRT